MGQSTNTACPQPAPAGRVAGWTFRLADGPVHWDWSLGSPEPRALRPIRTPRSTEKSRHIPVQAYSTVTASSLKLESGLEYDLVLALDRESTSAWLVPQPARLAIEFDGKRRRTVHTPDLLALNISGTVTIWNVRATERQDEKFLVQSAATKAACADVGWRYAVFTGHTRAKTYNLRWLAAYRRPMPWYAAARDELAEICGQPGATAGEVLVADQGSGHLIAAMWHHVWRGDLEVDLDRRIGQQARVRWVAGPDRG